MVGSGCWLHISPSLSGPPKTRGSCCSLPELHPMLNMAPIAAPACGVQIWFQRGQMNHDFHHLLELDTIGSLSRLLAENPANRGEPARQWLGYWHQQHYFLSDLPGNGPGRHLSSRSGEVSLCKEFLFEECAAKKWKRHLKVNWTQQPK